MPAGITEALGDRIVDECGRPRAGDQPFESMVKRGLPTHYEDQKEQRPKPSHENENDSRGSSYDRQVKGRTQLGDRQEQRCPHRRPHLTYRDSDRSIESQRIIAVGARHQPSNAREHKRGKRESANDANERTLTKPAVKRAHLENHKGKRTATRVWPVYYDSDLSARKPRFEVEDRSYHMITRRYRPGHFS